MEDSFKCSGSADMSQCGDCGLRLQPALGKPSNSGLWEVAACWTLGEQPHRTDWAILAQGEQQQSQMGQEDL